MTKGKTGISPDRVSSEVVKKVEIVLQEAKQHILSVSRVFDAHNRVFGLNASAQSCMSCLTNRVEGLRKWYEGYLLFKSTAEAPEAPGEMSEGTEGVKVAPQYTDPEAPGYVSQAEGIVRYPMLEGIPFDFLPNKDTLVKGTVKRANGTKIKPGTYVTEEGLEIVVQPGGRANIRETELL